MLVGGLGNDVGYLFNRDETNGQELFAGTFDGGLDTDDLNLNGSITDYRIVSHLNTLQFYHQDYDGDKGFGRLIATATNIETFEARYFLPRYWT